MNILICDDNLKILQDFSRWISNIIPDSNIGTVLSGRELLTTLETIPCDVVLLDIDMPEMDGLEVAKELLELSDKPLLVFVTSHDELVYLFVGNKQPKRSDVLEYEKVCRVSHQHISQSSAVLHDVCGALCLCQLLSGTVLLTKG